MTSLTRINGAPWNQSRTFCTHSLHPSYIIITSQLWSIAWCPLIGWQGRHMAEQWPGWVRWCVMSPASCVRMFWLGRVLPVPAVSPSYICHLITVYTQGIQANTGARTKRGSQKTLTKSQSDLIRTLPGPVSAGSWLWSHFPGLFLTLGS